ncbi:hypothetical protein ACFX1S_046806 [Malus domestica]
MRKFRHKDRPCGISSSLENYSATRSRLLAIKIARNASPGSNHLVHKFINRKGSKATLMNLQSNVKVLEIMKFRHKDRPSPSQCDLFPENFFNYSVKALCYEDREERLSQIA